MLEEYLNLGEMNALHLKKFEESSPYPGLMDSEIKDLRNK